MSRIKQKKQGVNNSIVFTNQDNNEGTITFNGSVFTFSAPTTFEGSQQLLSNGSAAAPSLAFSNSTGVGLYRYASNVLGFATAGSERMLLTAGGALNIGTNVVIDGLSHTILGDRFVMTEGTGAAFPVTAALSGTVFFINSDTGATTWTLPAPAAGLHYKWVWTANCNNAQVIKTADTADTTGDMFVGGLLIAAASAVCTLLETGSDINTITVDDNANNLAGGVGSWIEVICTEDPSWFVHGVLNSTTDNDSTGAQFTDTD